MRTIGTSTSHWTGKINFPIMYNAGARFWIAKATDANKTSGEQFEDSRFEEHCKGAFDFGKLLTGCYHWLQASVDPTVAADFYLERYFRYKFDFPPVLDFEETNVRITKLFSDYAWRAEMWCRRVEDKTGLKPIIYTAKWYTDYFKLEHISWMSAYPLWVADYSWWANNVTKKPYYMPLAWNTYALWQNSANGNGRGTEFGQDAGDAELTIFEGDHSQLLDWLKVDTTPVVPLTLEEQVADHEKRISALELGG